VQAGDGSQTTGSVSLTLQLSASDFGGGSLSRMLLRERAWDGNEWAVAAESGWVNYATTYPWTLDTTPGAHYLNAYWMDDSGNVSQLPAQTVVNYSPASSPILTGGIHVYRVRVEAGESFTATLTTLNGDADLYVWAPGNAGAPDVYSNLDGAALDRVVVTDTVAGDYHLEVHGYAASSTYRLDLDAPQLTLTGLLAWLRSLAPQATTAKAIPAAPLTVAVPDADPAQAPGGLPAAIALNTPLSVVSPGGYETQINAQVWDHKGESVANGTLVTFSTTLGSFVSSGASTAASATTAGIARATLRSGDQAGDAVITATAGQAQEALVVRFRPYSLYLPVVLRNSP